MTAPPPQGLFGIPNLDDVTKLLPPTVAEAIQGMVVKILNPNDPNIKIGDPQPAGTPPIPVAAGSTELSGAVKAIDAMTSAIELILKMRFLIPDQYEGPLRGLEGALKTIRGWLD
jgi:hypothetical protein